MTQFPRKPSYGEACTRCGLCCLATPCMFALAILDNAVGGSPCPAVSFDKEGKSHCGMVDHLGETSEIAAALGIGEGCDSGPSLPPHEDELYGLDAPEFLARRFLSPPEPRQ